jgi:tRNA uridine 5-carboxymethylaminomethyl modification enzyme
LQGLMHVGLQSSPGGRLGDPPSVLLAQDLARLGLSLGRLKTGTPARLAAGSVDLTRLEAEEPEPDLLPFSHEGAQSRLPQLSCYIARTNERTHEIIRKALDRSPLFTGKIQGRGPRYCPSIEDKVVRFPDRKGHQVILEPTDLSQAVYYPNGISTSLPPDVQEEMIHSIEGLENARLVQPGYAIEYDFVHPTQLEPSLEARKVPGLFLAGQINGTSGYEEAAGQGLLAGINAAARVKGQDPLVLGRQEAYIGVMVDDLVSRGTTEPYRMFSSRAEFRLLLREDNALSRLMGSARKIGLVPSLVLEERQKTLDLIQEVIAKLRQTAGPSDGEGHPVALEKLLRRPEIRIQQLAEYLGEVLPPDVLEQVEVEVKYKGYVERQIREAEKLKNLAEKKIPGDFDYQQVPGLSAELRDKLCQQRPVTFAQASRLDGMTPAALMVLSVWLRKTKTVPRGTPQDSTR